MLNRRNVLALSLVAIPAIARSQSAWPTRPIRLIVPAPPGGTTDSWGRYIAQYMGASLGQPMVVENRAGASGMVGAQAVLQSPADGYSLLYHVDALVTAPITQKQNLYDALRDFAPIGRLGGGGQTFVVGPGVPTEVNSMAEYLEWGRRQKSVALGNWGAGGSGHAFAVLLEREGRLPDVVHVSYRGETPLIQAILASTVHGGFVSMLAGGALMREGRLRPIGTAGPNRVPSMANRVPTMLELGFSERFRYQGWHGMLAPAKTPPDILARLVDAFREMANSEMTLKRTRDLDSVHRYESADEFALTMQKTRDTWAQITEELGLYDSGG